MNALNCGGTRPPLPNTRKSLKSTFSCGADSSSSDHGQQKREKKSSKGSSKQFKYDPFSYDSTSMARDLLRGFIMTRKASLTHGEQGYLEGLADDGEEDDLNKAMKTLSDDVLFFNPCQRGPTVHASTSDSTVSANSSLLNDEQCSLNYSNEPEESDSGLFVDENCTNKDDENKDYAGNGKSLLVTNKFNEDVVEDNVEIIESMNGAIILQDLKVQNFHKRMKSDKNKNNEARTPVDDNRRSRSVPQSVPEKLGTSHRVRRVAERKGSVVHSSMWKAHKQGLSLTLSNSSNSMLDMSRNSSFRRNLFHGKINRSASPFLTQNRRNMKNRGRNSRNSSRTSSRGNASNGSISSDQYSATKYQSMSTSKLDKLEFVASDQLMYQNQQSDNSVSSMVSDLPDYASVVAIKDDLGSSSSLASTRDHNENPTHDNTMGSLEVPYSSRRHSHLLFNSSHSSIAGLDLASYAINDSQHSLIFPEMRALSRQNFLQESASKKWLDSSQDSVASFASLRHGQAMDNSTNSFSSLKKAPPIRQASDFSISSIQPAQTLCRESSGVSTESSVTLNSFNHSFLEKREMLNPGNFSDRPGTSPRHKAPMRPSRNPSPLVRPKLVDRSKSDGVLPLMKEQYVRPSRPLNQPFSKAQVKSRRIPGKIDVLDTIISQDSFVPRLSETEDWEKALEPIWTSPSISKSDDQTTLECFPTEETSESRKRNSDLHNQFRVAETMREQFEAMRKYKSMMSSFTTVSSKDDSFVNSFRGWREMRTNLSQDEITLLRTKMDANSSDQYDSLLDDNDDDQSLNSTEKKLFDCWNVLSADEDDCEYGLAFSILGTSADDVASTPHVLSPPLMESLYHFLPYSVSEQNYLMKYSLLRDGASYITLLQTIRGSQHTFMAIETTEGEVFGSFTSSQWRKNKSYFGSGEAFLWRMKGDRKTLCKSVLDQAALESDIEVFSWTGANYFTQLCTDEMIALGGGSSSGKEGTFGLVIRSNLLNGTTNFCATFGNPPLSREVDSGPSFEIVNLEVWTMTPCANEAEAEKLEMARLFLERNRQDATS